MAFDANINQLVYTAYDSTTGQAAAPALDALGNLKVAAIASGVTGPFTDRSGTITVGGTSQQLAAANAARRYLIVQNPPTATENLYINFTTAASTGAGSIGLIPGSAYTMESDFINTEAVTVIAATTGHVFTAKEG